jgi:hypothetical protein
VLSATEQCPAVVSTASTVEGTVSAAGGPGIEGMQRF